MDSDLKPLAACLADCGNDDGDGIHPSVAYIAWLLGWSERSVQRGMKDLKTLQALIVVEHEKGGRGLFPIYRLDVENLPQRGPWRKRKGDTPVTHSQKGDNQERVTDSTERVTPVSAKGDSQRSCNKEEPLENREIEPLGGSAPENLHPLNYAHRLAEEIHIPVTRQNTVIIAAAIESLIRAGKSPPAAYEFLLARTRDAIDEGVEVNKFWFEDGKYNYAAGKATKLSTAQQRQQRTRDSLTAAIRNRYGADAGPGGSDDGARDDGSGERIVGGTIVKGTAAGN